LPQYRDTKESHRESSVCWRPPENASLSLSFTKVSVLDGAAQFIRRNSRYIAIKYCVRGRDLGQHGEEASKK